MTKKELIDEMRDLNDDAEIHILCSLFDSGTDGYADDICFKDKVTGDDVMNELTIVACVFLGGIKKMTITKKELIDAMRDLNDDAEIHILCTLFDSGTDGYADDICFKDKVTGDDVMNELTIVACFF